MSVFSFSLCIWFFYYLINGTTPISVWIQNKVLTLLPEKVKTAFTCSYCFAFHFGWIGWFIAHYPVYFIFAGAALTHLINLVYLSLTQE